MGLKDKKMLIISDDGRKLYHAHIPRTGGRYLCYLFLSNNYTVDLWSFNNIFYGREVPHLNYPLDEIYLSLSGYEQPIPKFTVVRNPIKRLESLINILFYLLDKTYEEPNSMEDFVRLVNCMRHYYKNGWDLDQSDFIQNCFIWKYENGFGENFCEWIDQTFDFRMPVKESLVSYPRTNYDNIKSLVFGEKFEEYAKIYFEEEMKVLGYNDLK